MHKGSTSSTRGLYASRIAQSLMNWSATGDGFNHVPPEAVIFAALSLVDIALELDTLLDTHLVEPLDERPRPQCQIGLGVVRDVGETWQLVQHLKDAIPEHFDAFLSNAREVLDFAHERLGIEFRDWRELISGITHTGPFYFSVLAR